MRNQGVVHPGPAGVRGGVPWLRRSVSRPGMPLHCTSGFGSGSARLVTVSGCTAVLTVEVVATARRLLDEG
jgi:hypothetical protein